MLISLILVSLLLATVLTAFIMEMRKRKQLQLVANTNDINHQKYVRALNAVLRKVHAYVLLVDKDRNVIKTNYYERTRKVDDGESKKIGELLCCRNSILSGACGMHEQCGQCGVRNAVSKAFVQKRGFSDLRASLTLAVSYNRYVRCETLVSGSYLNLEGEERLVLTVHDITELVDGKHRNDKLEGIVNFTSSVAQVGFASLNLFTSEEVITPFYCINFCEDEEEKADVVMRTFRYVHPEDRGELLAFMDQASEGKVDPLCKEVRVMLSQDKWKWVKVFLIQREYSVLSGVNEVYSLNIDISDQKNIEHRLAKKRKIAENSDKLKSAFLANMSHEIRTPLNAIVGFSELLASASSEEEKTQFLQILKMNNEMLLQLINDILDMAKIEAGTLEFTYTDVDMSLLTSEMKQQFDMKLKSSNKDVQIIYEPGESPCVLNTDRNRIAQVLFNFMSNALKFTERGTIRFGYERRGNSAYFYVSDTGLGIKEEMLDNVFGRFARFHTQKKGNGLGLSISKTIIDKLGGEIGVDSVYGEGSTFWFTLPLGEQSAPQLEEEKSVDIAPVENTQAELELVATEPTDNKRYTVLVAEDMPDNYHLCAAILSKKYDLLWAKNGEEAIVMFTQHQPDMILMDLKMPNVDGYEATAAIRELSTTIPIVALTAFAYSDDRERVMKSGFSDFMTKPVSASILLNKVESLCRQYNP